MAPLRVYRTATGDFRLSEEGAIARGLIPGPDGLFPGTVARRLRRAGINEDALTELAKAFVESSDEAKRETLETLAMTKDVDLRSMAATVNGEVAVLLEDRAAEAGPVVVEEGAVAEPVVVEGGEPVAEPVVVEEGTPTPGEVVAEEVAATGTTVVEEVVVGEDVPTPTGAEAVEAVEPTEENVAEPTPREKIAAAVSHGRVGDVTDVVGSDPELASFALGLERDARARPSLLVALEAIVNSGD